MCLAKICKENRDGEVIAESVTALSETQEGLTVTNLFGDATTIQGKIKSIDFTDSIVVIEN